MNRFGLSAIPIERNHRSFGTRIRRNKKIPLQILNTGNKASDKNVSQTASH